MTDNRNIYLKMQSLSAAKAQLFEAFADIGTRLATETVPAAQAVGRVLAEPVYAKLSSPNFHAAAMDGIAVSAAATFGASESRPKTIKLGENAFAVNTGHVMPETTDAVIMIEHVQMIDDRRVEIEAPVFPWQNVRRMGEDIVATELLFARHHKVTPYCVGALLAGGIFEVAVLKRPKLLILPTGSELMPPDQADPERLAPGQVIESNAYVLGQMAEAAGAGYVHHDIVADDMAAIRKTVSDAAAGDFDIILVIGGSSAGSQDYARGVIEAIGQVHVHGVTIMPGKPTVIGEVQKKPAFGIPGYPVSAIIAFEQFVRPLISAMLHQPEPEEETIPACPTKKLASKLGMDEFVRVKLGRVDDRFVATPLPRGAGTITSITEADGIIRIPADSEGVQEGDPVSTRLIKTRRAVEDTIVAVGSHDNTIDVLADMVQAQSTRFSLSSSHVGSMGGLMAIKKDLCHFAGAHLLDTDDGSYNISYIKKYLPDIPVRVIRLVERDQGLIVLPGNPKNISGIGDLTRDDVAFINRQGGAGTRILLDYHLQQMGLDPAAISGYENEEFTHMAVAVSVLGHAADAGLGIHAAAKALDLDFIPVATESYDLVIPEAFAETDRLHLLYDIIASTEFAERVCALGGYHIENTGKLIWKNT
ncbi:MAG: molybdopterin biosynthesis protein [Thermodesulfobacteriota bacterium]